MKKKKRILQPEVFWNLNLSQKSKRVKKPKHLILVQPIPKLKNNNFKIKATKVRPHKRYNNNLTVGLYNQKAKQGYWNPKIQNPRKKPVKGQGFIPKNSLVVPRNIFSYNNTNYKHFGFSYNNANHRPFGFLNNAVPKQIKREPMALFVPVKMTPSSIFKKEDIYQRHLNPWGDADMDGTLNHMDCNPREVGQDGILGDIAGGIGRRISGVFKRKNELDPDVEEREQRIAQRIAEREFRKVRRKLPEVDEGKFSRAQIKEVEKFAEETQEARTQKRKQTQSKKEFKALVERRLRTNTNLDEEQIQSKLEDAGITFDKQALAEEKRYGSPKGIMKKVPLKLRKALDENIVSVEQTSAKVGGVVSSLLAPLQSEKSRRLRSLNVEIAKAEAAGKPIGELSAQRDRLRESITSKKVGAAAGLVSALTPLGAVPEIRKLASGSVPTSTSSTTSTSRSKKGRGRPKGSLRGGYVVDGQILSEADFQRLRSLENKRRKAAGMEKIALGARQFNQVKQAVSRPDTPQAVQEEEFERVVVEEDVVEQRRPQTLQEAQLQEQQHDNILNAPKFQKGELKETAGAFRDDPRYNILNAPNFQQGGLRNVGQTEETPAVQVGERPNPNPYGEEYTDIDPGSGKTIVQRRPNEKWATGEAL